jgi:hypothetical protein
MSIPTQKLHYRLFAHCAVQAASIQFGDAVRRAITQGALDTFSNKPDGYDFEATYDTLNKIYCGQYRFEQKIEALRNPELQMPNFPKPNIAVLNAKYLIESFVIANVPDNRVCTDGFKLYSTTVGQGFAIVIKAMDFISRSFKLS